MLNKQQLRQQVIQYFRSIGAGENIVQCIKEALFLHERFNPVIIFQMLSRGKQKIIREDWRQYLTNRNIGFSEEEARYFFNHNNYGSDITLNQFLESMIPYNADVIREFKAKYLDSLQIRELDAEVQFIFAQLMSNWIRFIRSTIKIRSEISSIATRKQIQHLIKEDLVLRSKPRQARKFHQAFQVRDFELTFHELRKFLELWISSKQIIHEFYLLNVKRHIKCENPFENIVLKGFTRSKSKSQKKKRAYSAQRFQGKKNNIPQLTNQKVRAKLYNEEEQQQDKEGIKSYRDNKESNYNTIDRNFGSRGTGNKYQDYKRQIMNDFAKEQHGVSPQKQKRTHKNESSQKNKQQPVNQQLRRSRYERENKGIDGTYVVKMFEQIVLKQQRLEKLRKNLAKANDFNLINLFKLIDYQNQGYITAKSLSDFTGDGRVQYNHLINFHAREKDRLRFQQFCIFFRPLSKQLNQAIDKRPEHRVPNPFKKQTTKLIFQVIRLTAELHSNLNRMRQRINRDGVSPSTLFNFVDLENKNYISAECIKTVLEQNSVFCESKDLKCLMKLFRKKIDQRISQKEFTQFVDL